MSDKVVLLRPLRPLLLLLLVVVVVVEVQVKALTWLDLLSGCGLKVDSSKESAVSLPHPVVFFPPQKLDLLNWMT